MLQVSQTENPFYDKSDHCQTIQTYPMLPKTVRHSPEASMAEGYQDSEKNKREQQTWCLTDKEAIREIEIRPHVSLLTPDTEITKFH